ncbi:hypothetical protein [Paludisphaera sp.]|uniref:hypothetical protein n=1 Tax=Paludisphaera sp. TaxID=2017432 RepID=UPI00301CA04C
MGTSVEFSTDPGRIAALRAEGESRRPVDALERFFRELPEMFGLKEAHRELLRERRREAVPRLLEVAARELATTVAGTAAIRALCALEEPAVLPIAREALRDAKATWRHSLMSGDVGFLATDAEIRRMLLEGLDSPDRIVAERAVQECGVLAIPGAVERFAELIHRPDAPDRPRLAFWLGALDPTPENVAAIEAAWLDHSTNGLDDYWFLTGLSRAIEGGGSPEGRRAAVGVLSRRFGEVRDGERARSFTATVGSALDALRRAAPEDHRCVEIALDMLGERGPVVLGKEGARDALNVIAAGDPPLHRATVLEMLPRRDAFPLAAAESLGRAYEGTGDAEVVAAILAARAQHGANGTFDEALARIGGAEAVAAVEGRVGDEPSMDRMRLLWRTRGLDPQSALDRLAALGVLSDADGLAQAAARSLRENWPDCEPEPADVFLDTLPRAGIMVVLGGETDMVPPRHDNLILGLTQATRGRFVVEAARESWNLPPGVSEEDVHDHESVDGSDYTVEFLHDGRVVAFHAKYLGDWRDVDALAVAMNEALRESGRDERFHPLMDPDQAAFLLVAPTIADLLRREFFAPIDGPARARGG